MAYTILKSSLNIISGFTFSVDTLSSIFSTRCNLQFSIKSGKAHLGVESNHPCVCLYPVSWYRAYSANKSAQMCKVEIIPKFIQGELKYGADSMFTCLVCIPAQITWNFCLIQADNPSILPAAQFPSSIYPAGLTCSPSGQSTSTSTPWALSSCGIALTWSL